MSLQWSEERGGKEQAKTKIKTGGTKGTRQERMKDSRKNPEMKPREEEDFI